MRRGCRATTPGAAKPQSAQVREVMLLPAGLYRLTLDNGQVWDTTEADSALAFKANDAVTISRRVLGGYEIFLAGHNTSVSAARKK
jgi:tRNA-dihydrouridine synthase